MQLVRRFLEMIRFSHTLFALPFALFSAVLAWYDRNRGISPWEVIGILLCMVFARSAAMAFNGLSDRDVDAFDPRTAVRHLPSGQLTVGQVWFFTLFCCAGFIASAAIYLVDNPWPIYLAGPVLLFVLAYSYTKRFTVLAHFWLGASLLLAPLAAWIAIYQFEKFYIPLILGLAVFFWVAGFDIIYACQDADFDRRAKLHSIPAWLGVTASLRLARFCHLLMIAMLVILYFVATPPLYLAYLIGIGGVAALLTYEHAIVRPDDLSRVNQAFFNVNVIVSVGLLAVLLLDIVIDGGFWR